MASILRYDPRWRSRSLGKEIKKKDRYLRQYRQFKEKGKPSFLEDVEHLSCNFSLRMKVELMLITCEYENEEIADFFGVDEKIINYYQKIFFDTEVIRYSQAKLEELANDCDLEEERDAKIAAIRFGRLFVDFFLGRPIEGGEEVINAIKKRLKQGLAIKSLGHEFLSASDPNIDKYLKMMNGFNKITTASSNDDDGEDSLMKIIEEKYNRDDNYDET